MRILLINPPFLPGFSRSQRSPAVTKGGTLYYPYWLAFAGAVLDKNKIKFDLLDCAPNGFSTKQVLEKIQKEKYDVMVIDTSTGSICSDVDFTEKVKLKFPNILTVLVGTHVTALPEETMKLSDKIDIIARREYEYTILDIATQDNYYKIDGISYRNQSGKIIHNKDRKLIDSLDRIPFIAPIYKKYLNIKNYYFAAANYPMMMMITGRGCPNGCTFCVYPQTMFSRNYRFRSVENVIEELKYIKYELPEVKEVVFEDDTLTADIPRLRKLCKLMISEGINFRWTCNSRVSNDGVIIDLETMQLMKKAGCRLIIPGFESGNQKLLDSMHKNITIDQSLKFMENSKKAGLLVHGCFMVGFPGETKQTMEKTLEFAKKLNPDSAQFYPAFVYPGTEMYKWAEDNNYITAKSFSKWLKRDGQHNCILDLPGGLTSEYLNKFCENAYRSFHFRPKYILKKVIQLFINPSEGIRSIKSAKNYILSLR